MPTTSGLQTIEDLIALPDDGKRYELHNGLIIEVGTSSRSHTKIGARIAALLITWLFTSVSDGEVTGTDATYQLNERETRMPDTAYVSAGKAKTLLGDVAYYPFAPDLAVEIKSLSNSADEMRDLALLYLRTGARLVWTIDYKKRAINAHRPGQKPLEVIGNGILDGYDVLPSLRLPLDDIFKVLGKA